MNLPEHITTGFDIDEAIGLAELCQRAEQVFAPGAAGNAKERYDALYPNQPWRLAHAIDAANTRALIMHREGRKQYAVVFWMPASQVAPASAPPAEAANLAAQVVKVINLPSNARAKPDKLRSVAYPPLTDELAPPDLGVRVHQGWLEHFDACKAQIELFFSGVIGAGTSDLIGAGANGAASSAPNEFEIYVTGHGAAGCVAALCVLYLKRRWEARIDFPFFSLKMVNFGSPKIGNKAFVDYYNKHMHDFSYRVQNLLDGATYEPATVAPLLYNLQLLLPGVDYVRSGDDFYMAYQHIGSACTFAGVGNPERDFNGPFRSTLLLPFSHGPAGYKDMLVEARAFQETYWKPVQRVATTIDKQRRQLISTVQKQGAELQKAIETMRSGTNGDS
jgi:hypothetical protein